MRKLFELQKRYGKETETKRRRNSNLRWREWARHTTKTTETTDRMREKAFQFGVLLFCLFRFYYNFVEVVPQWLNDIYFVFESFLVVVFIYSSNWNKDIRLIGLFGSIGSFLYFAFQYIEIFDFNPIGVKYFVPSMITTGILIVGIREWQHYQ